jgi:hypothetical protein
MPKKIKTKMGMLIDQIFYTFVSDVFDILGIYCDSDEMFNEILELVEVKKIEILNAILDAFLANNKKIK